MRILYTAEQITAEVSRVAGEIHTSLAQENAPLVALALMNGACAFATDLLRQLPAETRFESIRVSSYGDAHASSGELKWLSPLPQVAGCCVLLLDDVLDTGLTFKLVKESLLAAGATRVITAVAVDKCDGRTHDFEADHVALCAPNEYLVGYGMDDAGSYRFLPHIAILEVNEQD